MKKLNEEANSFHDIEVIVVSNDKPKTSSTWCGINGINNLTVLSDNQYQEFGTAYRLRIDIINTLVRSILLLDDNNIIRYVQYMWVLEDEPDYNAVMNAAKRLLLIY